jgi:hypothetical protein
MDEAASPAPPPAFVYDRQMSPTVGVLVDQEARRAGVGGELLCTVF